MNIIRDHKGLLFLFICVAVVTVLFWKFVLLGLVPFPGDIVIGSYYPWLNQKWGYEVGVSVKNPPMSDIPSLIYPWKLQVTQSWSQGKVPLWDPSSFTGLSLIGNFQAATFNPFHILFALPIDFNYAWGILVMIQPLLAMITMGLLLRYWKLSFLSSLIGSFAYGLSAPMIVWAEYNLHGFAIASLPLMILLIDKFIHRNILSGLGYSALVALIVFFGYPQHLYYILFFVLIYYLFLSLTLKFKSPQIIKQSLYLLILTTLGIGLSGIQLIPGLESVLFSIKDIDKVALQNSVLTLPWQQLLTIVVPDFFGNPATYNFWGVGYYESFAFYTSVVALTLSVWSLKNSSFRPLVKLMGLFILISLLLSLNSPLTSAIYTSPFLGLQGSVASRILFIYSFAISVLAAIGFHHLETLQVVRKKFSFRSIFDLFRLPNSLFIYIYIGIILGALGSIFYLSVIQNTSITQTLSNFSILNTLLRNLAWPFLISSLAVIFIFLSRKNKNPLFLSCLILILIADMYRFSWKYLPFIKEDLIFPQTDSIRFLKQEKMPFRIAIEQAELMPANFWSPYNLEAISGYNILLPKDTADLLSYINHNQIGLENARFIEIKNFNSTLLDLTNTKYILTLLRTEGVPDEKGSLPHTIFSDRFERVYQEGPVLILRSKTVKDRIYSVKEAIVVKDKGDAYQKLEEVNAERAVVVSNKPIAPGECNISLEKYYDSEILFKTECLGEGLVIVSNAFHPGWQAKINNQDEELLLANGNFQALRVPSGKSDVRLYFYPKSFKIGAIATAVSLSVVILYLIFNIYRKRKFTEY